MLRVHFLQHWYGYSDPGMEEALHDMPMLRRFAGLDAGIGRMPDETTILNFCHLLEAHHLAEGLFQEVVSLLTERGLILREGTIVDATPIAFYLSQAWARFDRTRGKKKCSAYCTNPASLIKLPLFESGNHRHFDRQSHRQPARHGNLTDPAPPEVAAKARRPVTPRVGTRSRPSRSRASRTAEGRLDGIQNTWRRSSIRQGKQFNRITLAMAADRMAMLLGIR